MSLIQEDKESSTGSVLGQIYDRLWKAYGPQHWWPGQSATEVVVGAILTQNTAWTNVERAIVKLKDAKALSWAALRDLPEGTLAKLIQPSGTYRVKAARLKGFVDLLWRRYNGSLNSMLDGELEVARQRLLAVSGIGPETADAILLYAGNRPTFVVDAYTKRILQRHFIIRPKEGYETIRAKFHEALPAEPQLFNEYHALLVNVGKKHCQKRARCTDCPLSHLPHDASPSTE